MTPAAAAARKKTRILIAFAAVYILWGSTYLFIKYAIETIPPFMLGGVPSAPRFRSVQAVC